MTYFLKNGFTAENERLGVSKLDCLTITTTLEDRKKWVRKLSVQYLVFLQHQESNLKHFSWGS